MSMTKRHIENQAAKCGLTFDEYLSDFDRDLDEWYSHQDEVFFMEKPEIKETNPYDYFIDYENLPF